jgi:hypothetical protein
VLGSRLHLSEVLEFIEQFGFPLILILFSSFWFIFVVVFGVCLFVLFWFFVIYSFIYLFRVFLWCGEVFWGFGRITVNFSNFR